MRLIVFWLSVFVLVAGGFYCFVAFVQPKSESALCRQLKDKSPSRRVDAAHALAELGEEASTETVKALIDAANDPDLQVRYAVLYALIEIKEEKLSVTAFGNCLLDPDADIRIAGCSGLSRLGNKSKAFGETIAKLLLTDQDYRVRCVAAQSLRTVDAHDKLTLNPLMQALGDSSEFVKIYAATTLLAWDMNNPEAKRTLTGIISGGTTDKVRSLAVRGFATHDLVAPWAAASLTEALDDNSEQVRYDAAYGLGKMGLRADGTIRKLSKCLSDPGAISKKHSGPGVRPVEAPGRRSIGEIDSGP